MRVLSIICIISLLHLYISECTDLMNPCDAPAHMGDIALTEEDVAMLGNYDDVKLNNNFDRSKYMKEKKRRKRAATSREERLWPSGIIPYSIEANFTGAPKSLLVAAMRVWENQTCLTFVEARPEHRNYIVFTEKDCGCCSFVGNKGQGPQAISIGKSCDKLGIILHELGHAIGFWHEHTRPDRDKYINVMYQNILTNHEENFNTVQPNEIDSLDEPYDFESIMHYAKNTFAKFHYLDSLVPRTNINISNDPGKMGQRSYLSDSDVEQTKKLYKCSRCGRTLQKAKDTFSSPGFDPAASPPRQNIYYRSEFCQWRIAGSPGELIHLNVTKYEIPKGPNCYNNYLQINDGYCYRHAIIGKLCGSSSESIQFKSTSNKLWLEYRVIGGSYQLPPGFSASYEITCGGRIVKDSGTITSPYYPNEYPPEKQCEWVIEVEEGYQVALIFVSFRIETHVSCLYDYLEVRDGDSSSAPLVGKFCGAQNPQDIEASSNKLYLKFASDANIGKEGFVATFSKEKNECLTGDHDCDQICINTIRGYSCECNIGYELDDNNKCIDACGGHLTDPTGVIRSPNFPRPYPTNKTCTWIITAPENHRITLQFSSFDVEGTDQECEYDLVIVSSMVDGKEVPHGSFCGVDLPHPITSDANIMKIVFTSDNTVEKDGFNATYFLDENECMIGNGGCDQICTNTLDSYHCSCEPGYILVENFHECKEGECKFNQTEPFHSISSPNYPNNYPNDKNCSWYFSTSPGHKIQLDFLFFELESHVDCLYDKLVVYDGKDDTAPVAGIFCNILRPLPIRSSANQMFVVFSSDNSNNKKGFEAIPSTVCGGTLTASKAASIITSHAEFDDATYKTQETCDWLIVADRPTNKILLRFIIFEIEEDPSCSYDHVDVFDGPSSNHKRLLHACGNKLPVDIRSSGDKLTIQFVSDDTVTQKGFQISYKSFDGKRSNRRRRRGERKRRRRRERRMNRRSLKRKFDW